MEKRDNDHNMRTCYWSSAAATSCSRLFPTFDQTALPRTMKLDSGRLDDLAEESNRHPQRKMRMPRTRGACSVCGDAANGVYFGAMVCLPCKSFFIRCTKDGKPSFQCTAKSPCDIQSGNRMRCQSCRFNKCLAVGMARREKPESVEPGEGQELCRVCCDIANGLHFGVMTCEGCKKFFRRALKEYETYTCKQGGKCLLNPRSRNACRFCRHQKCVRVGMSREAIRMGRPKKIRRGMNGFRSHHDLRLSTDLASAYYNSLGPPTPDAYSPPATAPAAFGPWSSRPSYAGMLDCKAMPEWPAAMPLSPGSSLSSSSSSSGQSSPSHGLCPQQQQQQQQQQQPIPTINNLQHIKVEPLVGAWTDCCSLGHFQPGVVVPPGSFVPSECNSNSRSGGDNTSIAKPLPAVGTIINSDVVDSLMQLASGAPRRAPRPSEANAASSLEDDAIDSLLKVLEDFEKSETPMEEGGILPGQLQHQYPLAVH